MQKITKMSVSVRIEDEEDWTERQEVYQFWQTQAPQAYDYAGVIQIAAGEEGWRIVAIPQDDVPVQCARYASGVYAVRPVDLDEVGIDVEDVLVDEWDRCGRHRRGRPWGSWSAWGAVLGGHSPSARRPRQRFRSALVQNAGQ